MLCSSAAHPTTPMLHMSLIFPSQSSLFASPTGFQCLEMQRSAMVLKLTLAVDGSPLMDIVPSQRLHLPLFISQVCTYSFHPPFSPPFSKNDVQCCGTLDCAGVCLTVLGLISFLFTIKFCGLLFVNLLAVCHPHSQKRGVGTIALWPLCPCFHDCGIHTCPSFQFIAKPLTTSEHILFLNSIWRL